MNREDTANLRLGQITAELLMRTGELSEARNRNTSLQLALNSQAPRLDELEAENQALRAELAALKARPEPPVIEDIVT